MKNWFICKECKTKNQEVAYLLRRLSDLQQDLVKKTEEIIKMKLPENLRFDKEGNIVILKEKAHHDM